MEIAYRRNQIIMIESYERYWSAMVGQSNTPDDVAEFKLC